MVTGKGGTGKTSLSASIGSLSASRGRRTLIVEVDNFHPSLTRLFNKNPSYDPVMVAPNLGICNITWHEALVEWLHRTIHVQRITKLILNNRIAMVFLDATPGAREIVILSKIVHLAESWDQVIVDLPASGHALGILRVPRTATRLMRTGPVRERAEQMLEVFQRPDTSLVIIGLPEEMVVNETLELWEKLQAEVPEFQQPTVVLNRAAQPSLTEDEISLLQRLSDQENPSAAAKELIQAGRWEGELEQATADAITRLEAALGENVVLFPRLGALGGFAGGADKVVQQMSAALVRQELRK